MSEFVVVDASLAFKWLVEDENSDERFCRAASPSFDSVRWVGEFSTSNR